jgi:ABC-type sugar transport system ATPase subunit
MHDVAFEKVTKKFGKVVAVNNISFQVNKGEFFTLLGPSGCGKTTTLRLIAGLEIPQSGNIYIKDKNVEKLLPKDRNIGMVFQNYALFPHMNVFDNIAYPLKIRKQSQKEIMHKVTEIAKNLQTEELLSRKPNQISGGQQQRVALGRAMVQEPDVFLFDEPLSNLDAKLRTEARSFLKHIQKEMKTTAIYVTHDQKEAMAISDRIAILDKGIIMQIGAPREIYKNPENVFVAGFIGDPPMNLLDCFLKYNHNKTVLDFSQIKLDVSPIRDLVRGKVNDGEAMVFGIRPEDIAIEYEDVSLNNIKGKVFVVERLGPETIIHVKIGDLILIVRDFGEPNINMGDTIWLKIDLNSVHIYKKEDGQIVI